jgi:cellulose 1,4-beta-cellobiosidase
MGVTDFYGPGATLDTTKKMTVVTQFIGSGSSLTNIKRFYIQTGKTYANSDSKIDGVTGNSITDAFCTAQKTAFGDTNSFKTLGGLNGMGASLARGHVLVMSLWDDHSVNMLWLDSTYPTDSTKVGAARGTCSTDSGKPEDVEKNSPDATVVFSDIKFGPIGSTFKAPA